VNRKRRIALLTGATRGIGRAILDKMAAHISEIHAFGRDSQALDDLARTFPDQCVPHRLDLSDGAAVERFIAASRPLLDGVDVFVHCAGDGMPQALRSLDLNETARLMELHCFSFLRIAKSVAPGMIERKRGRIVALGSLSNLAPKPFMTSYAASKAALVKAAQCLAAEVVSHNVAVNVVSPGSVETRLGIEGRNALAVLTGRDAVTQRQACLPYGRMLAPEDIADIIEFLIQAPKATITGQNIIVAGTTVMP
jgi:NAD(P)-dependent dehydrogenase (short-subunit alcohol dehydrogenase family)